jgi:protocatechuate 3,4-dioxygenase beta subunit
VDGSGNPVEGAHIVLRGGPTNVFSGSDGRFQITWRVPAVRLAAPRLLARDPARNLAGFAVIGEDSDLEVKLEPGQTVVATLKDPEGQPVTNGYAFFAVDMSFGDGEWVLDQRVPADGEGRLVDKALPRRSRVRVAIDAPRLGREELSAVSNETDVAQFEFPAVTMRRGNLKLAGKVLDAEGKPAAGMRVSVSPIGGQASDSTTTDGKGNFRFEHILPGTVTVTASGGQGVFGSGSGRGGDTNMEVRLRPPGGSSSGSSLATITGTVLDTNGMPAEGVLVMTVPGMPSIPGRAQPEVKTDEQGAFSVQWQPLGVSSSLIARDLEHNLAAVERIDSRTTERNLRLRPGLTIRGTVVDAAGKALPAASLRLSSRVFMVNDSVARGDIALNERGEFQVSGLPLDVFYTLTAQSEGPALHQKTVTEAQARVNLIQLEPLVLKPLNRPLAGRVLDADGKPVSGAEIRIANQHRGSSGFFTDSKGYFQTVASEDKTRVSAVSTRVQQGTANVEVDGGDTNVVIQFPAATAGRPLPVQTNTPGITLEIRCRTNVFRLGDEVPVELIFSSQRTNDYHYYDYADDRERPGQYRLVATTASGAMVPDPRGNIPTSEEASRRAGNDGVIHPGESITNSIPLNRWALIREPGEYRIQAICTNRYSPSLNGLSAPINITVLPRSEQEMADYISALDHQVTQRLALQAGKPAKPYDPGLHELALRLMLTGRPEILPSLFKVLEQSGREGNCLHEALAYYVPHTETIRRALAAEVAKDIPDLNVQNWLRFTLRNYSTNVASGTLDNLEPAGNAMGISLEIRCTNQVLKAGDEIPIEFIISNLGTEDYKYTDRSYDRSGRMDEYQLEAKAVDGSLVSDPRETFRAGIGGGLAGQGVLHPGESYSKIIPLNRWALVKDPGAYEVTATYHTGGYSAGSLRAAVTSEPLGISVLPRTSQEMDAYIKELTSQISAVVARRGTNRQPVPSQELNELVMMLMYTCSPAAVPGLLETMYEPGQGYWQAEALLYYIPRSEEVIKAVHAAAAVRGLAPNMQYVFRQYGEGTTEDEMKQYIRRSLAVDSPQTWSQGASAAQEYPDDAFNLRLIALATEPKGEARMQAIYALARNRTDDGVKTLKELLNDPDRQIYETTERAIRNAYTSRGNSSGRPLEPDDFDPKYQTDENSPEPRPVNLTGRPLPDLARLGVTPTDAPAGRPLLVVLIDADQRPSRRALSSVAEQSGVLKQKNVAVVVLQAAAMDDAAFAAWKKEAPPFPVGRLGADVDRARLNWGAAALPWLILTDDAHRVVAQGFAPDAIEAQLASLSGAGR